MRCDELRSVVDDGAPLDEAARAHLAECSACGEEFAALRALTSLRTAAPGELRARVLAGFPARPLRWAGLARAAAILLFGLGVGFGAGFAVKPAREVSAPGPKEIVYVERPAALPPDYLSNVAIAAERVYGEMVEVKYDRLIHVEKLVVDPQVKNYEKFCPVARQIGDLAKKLPEVVSYKKKEAKEEPPPPPTKEY
jgi:hypothetical protein